MLSPRLTWLQDERCAKLAVYPFLEKVYLERILQGGEVGWHACMHRADI